MKNLLNNISQEEKERILEMHKKNITVISEQQEPTVTNINGVDYFNPNITSEAKLNAFLNTGDLTKMNFPSLAKRWNMKINQTEDKDRLNAISQTFDQEKITKFVKNFLSFVAKQKRNPVATSTIANYLQGPLKNIFDWFNKNELKDNRGNVTETFYAVVDDNRGEFYNELMNIVNQQTAKANKA